jgi:molybdopterin synthase catalytic subunit/molybdopterin converting factor small subunit
MNKVTILFFATFKERAGIKRTELEIPEEARVVDLKSLLLERFPGLRGVLDSSLISINREYAFDNDLIPSKAEVAIFPPVSGGNSDLLPTLVVITEDPLDLDNLVSQIVLPSTGAVCMFSGIVREITQRGDPHETLYLEYEAYRSMAEEKMSQVAKEIRTRWPDVEGIAIIQRIGRLDPGTPTVLIACSASHRDSGIFEASRYGIDRLKEIVPIWKKEVGPGGEIWVEGEYIPTRGD